jgi:hypothetical protein
MSFYDQLDRERRCWFCYEVMEQSFSPLTGAGLKCKNKACHECGVHVCPTITVDANRANVVMGRVIKGQVKPNEPFEARGGK